MSNSKCHTSLFLGTLAENNRLRLVSSVVVAFGKLMSAARGEVLCSVTTAKVQYITLIDNYLKSVILERCMHMYVSKYYALLLLMHLLFSVAVRYSAQ